jgi:hypothetical protein
LGGDDGGVSSIATTTTIASLGSLVSVTQKEERENDKHKGTNINKKKIAIGGLQET